MAPLQCSLIEYCTIALAFVKSHPRETSASRVVDCTPTSTPADTKLTFQNAYLGHFLRRSPSVPMSGQTMLLAREGRFGTFSLKAGPSKSKRSSPELCMVFASLLLSDRKSMDLSGSMSRGWYSLGLPHRRPERPPVPTSGAFVDVGEVPAARVNRTWFRLKPTCQVKR
jgi:hypothetical protein